MRISDWSSDVCSSDLLGNAVNHLEHAADFLAVAFQLMNDFGGLLDVTGQPPDAVAGEADDLSAAGRFAVRAGRHLGRALPVEGDFLPAGGHLPNRRGRSEERRVGKASVITVEHWG